MGQIIWGATDSVADLRSCLPTLLTASDHGVGPRCASRVRHESGCRRPAVAIRCGVARQIVQFDLALKGTRAHPFTPLLI